MLKKMAMSATAICALAMFPAVAQAGPKSAGALAFSPDGVLFVGDSKDGAIHAYPLKGGSAPTSVQPFSIEDIDAKIAVAIGVAADRLTLNGMAVHPVTRDVYLSASVRSGDDLLPIVVRVTQSGRITPLDLDAAAATVHRIEDVPTAAQSFRSRVGDWPVPAAEVYEAKARTPMRSLAIVDMKFHKGELFVSGISNQEFASTLRRVKFPFDGAASESQVRIYHLSHGRYETRAPIRAMQFATIDGQDTLIAAYTCSPIVLIPVGDLKPGAKVTGKTLGDMGNGQPISMVSYKAGGQDMLFVTNAGRTPAMIPISGFTGAQGYTPENAPAPYMMDTSPQMPIGPMGKAVMFVGSSLRADLLNEKFFVSLTREAETGGLTLEALPTAPLPMRLDTIWSEFDFPGGEMKKPGT